MVTTSYELVKTVTNLRAIIYDKLRFILTLNCATNNITPAYVHQFAMPYGHVRTVYDVRATVNQRWAMFAGYKLLFIIYYMYAICHSSTSEKIIEKKYIYPYYLYKIFYFHSIHMGFFAYIFLS